MSNIYLGLVHYPVINKFNETVTTSITNLDIHDISRSCCTFGVKKFFVISPLMTQKELLSRILDFWKTDLAIKFNPFRVEALRLVKFVDSIRSAQEYIKKQEEISSLTITTSATKQKSILKFSEYGNIDKPVLLLFGTGNGLSREVHELADFVLEPITGSGEYNHLSVRSAVAIVLDRLTSEK